MKRPPARGHAHSIQARLKAKAEAEGRPFAELLDLYGIERFLHRLGKSIHRDRFVLKGALLICHGMVDTNVHFQDSVRLAQRLIELRKENWELAAYPVENHGFTEETSWADEYKRILKLFEENLRSRNGKATN